jgi:hypothetical protein
VASETQDITAEVVRVDPAQVRFGQALVPVATIVAIAARRLDRPLLAAVFVGVGTLALLSFVFARRSLGSMTLRFAAGGVLWPDGSRVSPSDVNAWVSDGSAARLYSNSANWKLKVAHERAEELASALRRVFGPPISLARRGTPRARSAALAVGIAGGCAVAFGLGLNLLPLVLVGVPSLIFGLAAFGALSQKIAR